jgi:ankyrin repeat protein
MSRSLEMLELLLESGCDVNAESDGQGPMPRQRAIHWFAHGPPETTPLLERLLKVPGIDVDVLNGRGMSPLDFAKKVGPPGREKYDMLKAAGATLEKPDHAEL